MMENVLLEQGLTAMCIGMGVVLAFLIVLIGAMMLMSKAVGYLNQIFPEVVAQPVAAKKSTAAKDDELIAVAIAAAIARA